ncbi:hypothetical protein AB0C77_18125 [Streptomyces sp. NPDC048629]|uniref:hypothetical protein n=1 Tax=Streptomyces sp. NPDC048629 TaxID=3154824 RepID=UPI003423CD98
MAGQGSGGARRAVVVLLTLLALAGLLAGCVTASGPADPAAREIQRLLDSRAGAVLRHDPAGYVAAFDPGATAAVTAARREYDHLADVPFGSWTYRVTDIGRTGPGRAVVRADLRYRIRGYDSGPVTTPRELELTERDDRWYVTAERDGAGASQQLWQQGDVEVVRGGRSLVLGVGQSAARLRAIAAEADRAVPAVSAAWPRPWTGRVVILVPASLDAMGRLLGAPAAGYRGIAAVTTGETGGGADAPADRVIVNPDAYGVLGTFGRQVVLTHETTHVATRAHTSAATPMWLSEGFADWAAYRGSGRTAAQAAPELRRAVQDGTPPDRLPEDEAFAFSGDGDALARAYESGWLACELVAARWGEAKLTAFYAAVGAHPGRAGAVEKALHDVLSTTPDAFTAEWRAYLRERLA